MATRSRSVRQEQLELVSTLREQRASWPTIARALSEQYGINMRVAFRLAHGWSQREAADRWNQRWPAEPKTFKNLSYWENWPSKTGYEPSLDVLARLAELYECSASDLLSDYADFSLRDGTAQGFVDQIPALFSDSSDRGPSVGQVAEMEINEIARLSAIWANGESGELDRRSLLLKLAAGLSLGATAATAMFADSAHAASATGSEANRMTGIWRSHYQYRSTGRQKDLDGTHYVVVNHQGSQLTAQSVPNTLDSLLSLDLSMSRSVLTGTWTERTSPAGYYKGAIYHGAIQLLIDPTENKMTGKWLGFDKDGDISSGPWELVRASSSTSPTEVRRYYHKA